MVPIGTAKRWARFKWLYLILMVGLALRLFWAFWVPMDPVPAQDDTAAYDGYALTLVSKGVYGYDVVPSTYRPPGYPFFLSLVYLLHGHSYAAVRFYQALLGTASILLVYLITRRQFSGTISLAAAAIYALVPENIFYTSILFSEIFFTFSLLLVLFCLLSDTSKGSFSWRTVLGGLAFGIAVLTRPIIVFLPLAAGLVYLWPHNEAVGLKRGLTRMLIFIVAGLIVVLPWTWRNYRLTQSLVPVATNGGVNLFLGNHPTATGRGEWPTEDYSKSVGLGARTVSTATEEAALEKKFLQVGLSNIIENPLRFSTGGIKKIGYLFDFPEGIPRTDSNHGNFKREHFLFIEAFSKIAYILLLLVAGLGFIKLSRKTFSFSLFSFAFLALYSATVIMTFGDPRFHFPLTFLLAIAAAQYCSSWSFHALSHSPPKRTALLVIMQLSWVLAISVWFMPRLLNVETGVFAAFIQERRLQERQSAAALWLRQNGLQDAYLIVDGYPPVKRLPPARNLIVRNLPASPTERATFSYYEGGESSGADWQELDTLRLEVLLEEGFKVFAVSPKPFDGSNIVSSRFALVLQQQLPQADLFLISNASDFDSPRSASIVSDDYTSDAYLEQAVRASGLVRDTEFGFLRPKNYNEAAELYYRIKLNDNRHFVVTPKLTVAYPGNYLRIWVGSSEQNLKLLYSINGEQKQRDEQPIIRFDSNGATLIKIEMYVNKLTSVTPWDVRLDSLQIGYLR